MFIIDKVTLRPDQLTLITVTACVILSFPTERTSQSSREIMVDIGHKFSL